LNIKACQPPTPQDRAESDQNGHPGQSEGERGGRAEEWMGAGIISILTADERRFYGSFGLVNLITLKLYFRQSPHLQPPPRHLSPTSHPKPTGIIEKRLPPPRIRANPH